MKVYDSAFLIGKSHQELATPCQDYALCFETALGPVSIVADGCSQAGQTDIGARIWALSAKWVIQNDPSIVFDNKKLSKEVVAKASLMLDDLPYEDGFSTLIICANFEDTTYTHVFGDGVVLVQNTDLTYEYRVYNYSPNAPFYLNYLRKNSEWEAWANALKFGCFTEDISRHTSSFELQTTISNSYPVENHRGHLITHPSSSILKIMIATDGATSFQDPAFNHALTDTLKEIGQFKSLTGQFVHRRMAALSRKIAKNQFSAHFDDLAVACICSTQETSHG